MYFPDSNIWTFSDKLPGVDDMAEQKVQFVFIFSKLRWWVVDTWMYQQYLVWLPSPCAEALLSGQDAHVVEEDKSGIAKKKSRKTLY